MDPENQRHPPQPSGPPRVTELEAVAALERDADLMLRVRSGDSTCFALLLERYRRPVIRFLFRMVQDQPVAEELAQEVFLRVYRARESYEPSAKFTTWLFRIASHLALNWIRDRKHEKYQERIDADSPDGECRDVRDQSLNVEQRLVREARLRQVRQAIEALPAKQRAAVLMHKYEEMEYGRIARSLNCSESAVKSLLFRAYENLRGRLASFG